jgi:pSer/pThr/pTyr-binding forkhead associated (FHA) protein
MDAPTQILQLRTTSGNSVGTELQVTEELVIGRGAEGEGRLADDIELSRMHARVVREPGGGFMIEDLGSTNGTFVNGLQITGPQPLSDGDTIEVGSTTMVVQVGAPAPGAAPAESTVSHEPADPTEAAPAAEAPVHVALRVDIDLAAREARLTLDEGSDEVKLVNRAGRWQIVHED